MHALLHVSVSAAHPLLQVSLPPHASAAGAERNATVSLLRLLQVHAMPLPHPLQPTMVPSATSVPAGVAIQ